MKVYKYGANVDTDVIIPARHLNDPSPAALASHCMEDIDPDFASTVEAGDLVVAGPNFGCGSSREHAPLALKSMSFSKGTFLSRQATRYITTGTRLDASSAEKFST